MFDGWEANTGRISAFAQQPISGRAAFAKRRVGHYKKSDSDPGCQLEVNNYHLQNPKMSSKNINKTKKRMTPLEFAPAAPKAKSVKKKSIAAEKVEEVLPVLATSKDLPPVPPVDEPPVPAVDEPPVPPVAEPLPDVAEPPVPDVAEPSVPSGVVPSSEYESVHGSDNEEHEEGTSSCEGKNSKKKKKPRANNRLTDEQEDRLLEFLEVNDFLWRRGSMEYRNSQKKQVAWKKIADEFDLPVEHLKGWWKSIQTWFGKINKFKSGQAPRRLTDRERYVLQKCRFYEAQLKHRVGDPMVPVSNIKLTFYNIKRSDCYSY